MPAFMPDELEEIALRADIHGAQNYMLIAAMDHFLLDIGTIVALLIADEDPDRDLLKGAITRAVEQFIERKERAAAKAQELKEAAPWPITPLTL